MAGDMGRMAIDIRWRPGLTAFSTSFAISCVLGQSAPASLDRAAILRELQDVSLGGMDRRLGPDSAFYHRAGEPEKFPEIWMAPAKQGPGGRVWQIGGPWMKDAGATTAARKGKSFSCQTTASFRSIA